jgi:transcriptional regulator with XRE-family HTH domain
MGSQAISERSVSAIGQRLRAIRAAVSVLKGDGVISQTEFAESIGIGPSAYNQFETGARRITVDASIALRDKYQVTLDYIYLGDMDGLSYRLADLVAEANR